LWSNPSITGETPHLQVGHIPGWENEIKDWAETLRSGHGSCMLAVSPEIKTDIPA